ncbi:xanthine dehydrogenase family protein molybdopterin-binding subunit [Flagellimonas allohymeniacidonis]|uniref:Xanthine dehydrogenase family protein molybdopterin-binding subunit n=1 Tax=Flagellimonas allohymeniacidonis TaxID=2517819 RepID=A0A4Q8QMP6_9FLAO|nr:molybdopterin cofactor-binding domain-containing protein [Allomuricauda hymeniacidonis]TAI49586.1 xanthine dehydrogenase family protein molybdopterin-binding subunit [Allomuricauda hymeniacidonis]
MLTRRKFVQLTGVAGGGLVIGIGLLESCEQQKKPPKNPLPNTQNGFGDNNGSAIGEYLQIRPDGQVFINIVKHEMGQGIASGLMAIVAEELDADWDRVHVVYSDPIPGLANWAGGSTSTLNEWGIMRSAGALARKLLIQAAAKGWAVDKEDCFTDNNHVHLKDSENKVEYGELVDKIVFDPSESEVTELKDKKQFKLVGKVFSNKIIPDIVLGKHPYALDIRLPEMKYAAIERAPVFGGRLVDFEATEALQLPGVEQVVPIKGFVLDGSSHIRDGVAVIANSTWTAFQARKKLKITWEAGEKSNIVHERFLEEAHQRLREEDGYVAYSKGDVDTYPDAEKTISHTYEFPYQHHACMEPLNATAIFMEDRCEVWTGTQAANYMLGNIEKHLGVPKENIKLHCHPSGGGFGLRYWASHGMEALLVSKAAGGQLVKMVYSREDDIQFDFLNPLEINTHTMGFKEGDPVTWQLKGALDNWGGLCAWMIYDVPNVHAELIGLKGFTQMSAWRSVMANAEGFSTECFIDEVAVELGEDPLEFRLGLLPEGTEVQLNHKYPCKIDRIRKALKTVAQKGNWGRPMEEGSGQGIAVYPYMHGNGYAAAIAEVSIESGQVKVDKIFVAIECGLVINPDFVKKQMEGGVIWALSALFYGGTEYDKGKVTRSNFHDNKVLRIHETPEIEVYVCESDEEQPWGVGEIAPPVTYPAVCNAIFAATGKRIRKLPISTV